MSSPPVQPIAASFSGAGAVSTMYELQATSLRSSCGQPVAQALSASTACLALTAPRAVVTTAGGPASRSLAAGRILSGVGRAGLPRAPRASRGAGAAHPTPPPAADPAVAPARAAAADVLLEYDDPQVGLGLRQEVGGPEAREASANDDHVGGDIACQGRPIGGGLVGQGFPEPPAALGARGESVACEIQRSWRGGHAE